MAQIIGKGDDPHLHPRLSGHLSQGSGHLAGTAEQAHPAVGLLDVVAAKADGKVRRGQNGCQQRPLGSVESIKFINVHGTPGKKITAAPGILQPACRLFLAVAGVHGGTGQQAFVCLVDQGQFSQLVLVGTGSVGIFGQLFRAHARAFQLVDGLGGLLAEGCTAPLAAVIHHLVQQGIQCPAN